MSAESFPTVPALPSSAGTEPGSHAPPCAAGRSLIRELRDEADRLDASVTSLVRHGRTLDALAAISRAQGLRQRATLAAMGIRDRRAS